MAVEYIDDTRFVSGTLATCPFCGSSDIEGDGADYDWSEYAPREMSETVKCLECGKRWRDVFEYSYSEEETG